MSPPERVPATTDLSVARPLHDARRAHRRAHRDDDDDDRIDGDRDASPRRDARPRGRRGGAARGDGRPRRRRRRKRGVFFVFDVLLARRRPPRRGAVAPLLAPRVLARGPFELKPRSRLRIPDLAARRASRLVASSTPASSTRARAIGAFAKDFFCLGVYPSCGGYTRIITRRCIDRSS